MLREGKLDDKEIEIEVRDTSNPMGAFDVPGIYALAFFRDGQEEWERHFFFFDSKWSDPRYEYTLNLTLHKRHPEWEATLPRNQRSTYHSAYN